ncbi:MAG: hypothetical protein AAGA43_05620 [Bacteroidota bacterium]
MKHIFFLIIFLFFLEVSGQRNEEDLRLQFSNLQESVYVSYNESALSSGEYFYYKFHCFNVQKKQGSELSKIGYIELIGKDGSRVFMQKVKLKNGFGYGDFFVPTTLESGNYKLIAYTNWMKNWGQDSFYQSDIVIVNPYRSNQSALFNNSKEKELGTDGIAIHTSTKANTSTSTFLRIDLPKKNFGRREKVDFWLKNRGENPLNGSFSVSVRYQKSFLNAKPKNSVPSFDKIAAKSLNIEGKKVLPELRGELITGVILDRENSEPITNAKVIVSLSNEKHDIRMVNTDDDGRFYASFDDDSQRDRIFVQLADSDLSYKVVLDNNDDTLDKNLLNFGFYELSENASDVILERSIQNQIENAYFSLKPDTLLFSLNTIPFYGDMGTKYVLDDYTRFPTIEETVLEIVNKTWLSKKNNDIVFVVRSDGETLLSQEYGSLLMVDGFPVLNQKQFIQNYEAYKIESITVVNSQYRIGNSIFDGLIDIKTRDLDYLNNKLESNEGLPILRPVTVKNYYRQEYKTTEKYLRIPDQRRQLLWNPNLDYKGKDEKIEFFTSDITGNYTIIVEGFLDDGSYVKIQDSLSVD